jgi:hypothetical protein
MWRMQLSTIPRLLEVSYASEVIAAVVVRLRKGGAGGVISRRGLTSLKPWARSLNRLLFFGQTPTKLV